MKIKYIVIFLLSLIISNNNVPLSQKGFNHNSREYQRGIFLIVLASQSLENYLGSQIVGDDFIEFKKSQGFDVDVVALDSESINSNTGLKGYLQSYKNNNPMLEYVLLVGDWNGSYDVPTFTIPSYNEDELDVTDYTYTYVAKQRLVD